MIWEKTKENQSRNPSDLKFSKEIALSANIEVHLRRM